MTLCHLLWKVFREIFTVVLTILFMSIIVVLIILGLPTYLYRYIVSVLARYFRPDLCKMLTTRSTIFAVDNLYKRPRASVLVFMILNGSVDIDKGRAFILEKLVNAVDSEGRSLRPELRQFVSHWIGFYFWKNDEQFDIANHAKVYDGPLRTTQYDESMIIRLSNELITKPFTKNRSPWEFISFPNMVYERGQKRGTAICLKLHHTIADGFTILKLVNELITSEGLVMPMTPNYVRAEGFYRVFEVLSILIQGPYQLCKAYMSFDLNQWHIREKRLSRRVNGEFLEKFPIDAIKDIKNKAGVSFTSVLLAAFSGGIRKFMIEQKVKVPPKIHCIAPLPMVGHPNKMRNFMTLCYVALPVGIADPIKRMHAVEKHLTELKRSTLPLLLFHLMPFVGGVYPCIVRFLAQQCHVTAVMSNFPGPPDPVYYCGIPVDDMIFLGGMLPGNIGVGLVSLSYNGFIRIGAGVDEAIVAGDVPLRSLVEKVAKELDILHEEVSV